MATKHDFHRVIIGRAELLSFVDFDLKHIPAKTDTGAYCSAIHAENIKVDENGVLSFDILSGHPMGEAFARHVKTDQYSIVNIENSFGHNEERYEVKFRVKLGPKIFTTRFTLANRAKKIYPILIGRKMLNSRFLVDTSVSAIDVKQLKVQYNIDLPEDPDDAAAESDGFIPPQ